MKKILLFLMVLIGISSLACADVYIKREVHTESYYEDGFTHPAVDRIIEMWIGNKQAAYISNSRIIITDFNKNLMFFINKDEKTYVEIPLPFELSKVINQQLAPLLQYNTFTGTVKTADEFKTIDTWECRGYDINGSGPYVREIKTWVLQNPQLDMETYNKMKSNLLKLHNYADDFIKEMQKIKGIGIKREEAVFFRGSARKRIDKILEITQKTPKTNPYLLPAGYNKKAELSQQDLEQDNLHLFLWYPVKL